MCNHFEHMESRTLNRSVALFIAEGAYAGKSPFAPGTAGTFVGVLLYFLLKGLPPMWYLLACIIVTGVGIWAAEEAEKLLGQKDAPSIVIDEIAGYLIAMIHVPSGWGFAAAGFLLFRVFDIIKPYPFRRLQNLHGGLGVVIDDIGAGIYTNIVLQIAVMLLKKT